MGDEAFDINSGSFGDGGGQSAVSGMRLSVTEQDLGRMDSLRRVVLTRVVRDDYASAISELESYVDSKSAYPKFKERAERYIGYAIDLINAIKAKKSFPGLTSLGVSKQQELYDRSVDHFNDLKATLRMVERIEREVKLEDVRSTVWVVQALFLSVFAILMLAFFLQVSKGFLPALGAVIDNFFDIMSDWLFKKFGL